MGSPVEYPGATSQEMPGEAILYQFSSKLDSTLSNGSQLELLIYQPRKDQYCALIESEPMLLTVATIQTQDSKRQEDRYYFMPDGSFVMHDEQTFKGKERQTHKIDQSLDRLVELGELIQKMIKHDLAIPLEEHPTVQKLKTNTLAD
jgi:hypothetical protein